MAEPYLVLGAPEMSRDSFVERERLSSQTSHLVCCTWSFQVWLPSLRLNVWSQKEGGGKPKQTLKTSIASKGLLGWYMCSVHAPHNVIQMNTRWRHAADYFHAALGALQMVHISKAHDAVNNRLVYCAVCWKPVGHHLMDEGRWRDWPTRSQKAKWYNANSPQVLFDCKKNSSPHQESSSLCLPVDPRVSFWRPILDTEDPVWAA